MERDLEIKKAAESYYYDDSCSCLIFSDGVKWADKNPSEKVIAKYLHENKGYPITPNGNVPSFEELMSQWHQPIVDEKKEIN